MNGAHENGYMQTEDCTVAVLWIRGGDAIQFNGVYTE